MTTVNGIGINGNSNYWIPDTIATGYSAMPTCLWSYDLSGMYPQDSIGTLNDIGLSNFDVNTNNLVNQVAILNSKWMPVLNSYMANMSAWYQNMMMGLSSGTNNNINWNNFFPVNNANNNGSVNNGNNNNSGFASKIDESDVSSFIGRLGADPKWKSAFDEKIKLEDGTEVTMLQRLMDLINDYMTNENPELSEEEFNKIREIAGKYAKTGKIDRDDFITLKKIIQAHTGKIGDEPTEPTEPTQPTKATRSPNYTDGHVADMSGAAELSYIAMDGPATNKSKLRSSLEETSKYNIIEFLDAYDKIDPDGNTWIKKFWGDFDHYDNSGESNNPFGHDNAKPVLDKVVEKLNERVIDIKNLSSCTDEQKAALDAAVAQMNAAMQSLTDANNALGEKDSAESPKGKCITAFDNLRKVIAETEEAIYGREA